MFDLHFVEQCSVCAKFDKADFSRQERADAPEILRPAVKCLNWTMFSYSWFRILLIFEEVQILFFALSNSTFSLTDQIQIIKIKFKNRQTSKKAFKDIELGQTSMKSTSLLSCVHYLCSTMVNLCCFLNLLI